MVNQKSPRPPREITKRPTDTCTTDHDYRLVNMYIHAVYSLRSEKKLAPTMTELGTQERTH